MGKVFVDLGITLDGYVAGPNGRPGNPLGDGGLQIHEWMFRTRAFCEHLGLPPGGETGPDDRIVRDTIDRIGANVMGRRMFDEGEIGWPEEAPFHCPVYVLTHRPREPWVRSGGTTFHFVTEGFAHALDLARKSAGHRDVRVSGGASTVRQALEAGVVDELTLHLSPLLLGGGVRLFDTAAPPVTLEPAEVTASAAVTHLRYRVS